MICINPTSIEKKFSYQNIEILLLHIVIVSVLSRLLMMVNAGGFIIHINKPKSNGRAVVMLTRVKTQDYLLVVCTKLAFNL